jgi:hypothetical protein
MANKIALGNFNTIQMRAKLVLANGRTIPDPFKGATTLTVFKQAVADGRRILPTRYQARYVDVLEQVVTQAEQVLASLHPRDGASRRVVFEQLQDIFSITAAPIVQLNSTRYQRELKSFLALISNIYGRFINDSLVAKGAHFNIHSPDLDPLGSFGHDEAGPFTLPASADMPVAIVSKPANEMNFLPFWAADGHEVGGHDIYGAVEGFEAELAATLEANIRAAFLSGRVKPSQAKVSVPYRGFLTRWKSITMEEFMVRVWKAWLPEASSDHAGLGNIGPMYLDSLMLLLSCVRPQATLAASGTFDSQRFAAGNGFEPHPIDIVRVLLCGEALKLMKFTDGQAYGQALVDRLKQNQGGTLPAKVKWNDLKGNTVIEVPLSDFEALLPVVAETVLNAKLKALAGQSFAQIVNWMDSDEAIVQSVAAKLAAGDTKVDENAEARHVVAASMLALEAASLKPKFASTAQAIHDTGISVLKEMYETRCFLCSIVSPAPGSSTPLVDVNRLFKHIKSR